METSPRPATFLLVHGAWHGGWCWQWVANLLTRQGHRVICPTLAGCGHRRHQAGPADYYAHVEELNALIWSYDLRDVVLCGHSYGGMVITAVAAQCAERIRCLVYLDAFVPAQGEAAFDVVDRDSKKRLRILAGIANGFIPPPRVSTFGVEDVERQLWSDARCTSFPLRCFEQTCRAAPPDDLPRWYVKARLDKRPSFWSVYSSIKERADWHVAELECGHDTMLISPEETSRVLLQAAGQTRA